MGILKFGGLLAIPAAFYYLLRNQRYKKVFSGLCSLFKSGSTSPPGEHQNLHEGDVSRFALNVVIKCNDVSNFSLGVGL